MTINNEGGWAVLIFQLLEIRFVEYRKGKRIEVIIRSHPNADEFKARKVFQDIYYIIIEGIDDTKKRCRIEGLQVKTLIHPPPEDTSSCETICLNDKRTQVM